jgi:hypothetical protein
MSEGNNQSGVSCFFCRRPIRKVEQVARIRRPDGSKGFSHAPDQLHGIGDCRLGGDKVDTVEGWWQAERDGGLPTE